VAGCGAAVQAGGKHGKLIAINDTDAAGHRRVPLQAGAEGDLGVKLVSTRTRHSVATWSIEYGVNVRGGGDKEYVFVQQAAAGEDPGCGEPGALAFSFARRYVGGIGG